MDGSFGRMWLVALRGLDLDLDHVCNERSQRS
jgi:hypothetical protein